METNLMFCKVSISNEKSYNLTDLEQIMATSRDWDELVWAWEGWRDVSGRQMPDMYEEYAGILNQAADMNGQYFLFHFLFTLVCNSASQPSS